MSEVKQAATRSAKEWVLELSKYRNPNLRRSVFELAITLLPFALLVVLLFLAGRSGDRQQKAAAGKNP